MILDNYYTASQGNDTVFHLNPPKIKFGRGALRELGFEAKALGMSKIALFTDPQIVNLQPVTIAKNSLEAQEINVTVYSDVEVEPTDRSLEAAINFAQAKKFDGYISVGGGSVIDTTKATNLYVTYPADLLDYVNAPVGRALPVPGPLKPHIACPTTFGTASECTGMAIFDLLKQQLKTGIASMHLRPNLGIVDPNSLKTLPSEVVAANGFDVFSHAVESLTCKPFTGRVSPLDPSQRPIYQGANPYSDISCIEAIKLIGANLVRAVNDREDDSLNDALSFSGVLAGIGFGNAGCHIPHAMSYAVAGLVNDYKPTGWETNHPLVPHGSSVIVNAPAVFRFTGPACPERHLEAAKAMGADVSETESSNAGQILANQVINMMKETNMPSGISSIGYSTMDIEALTERTWAQQRLLVNSPRPIEKSDIRELFKMAMNYF